MSKHASFKLTGALKELRAYANCDHQWSKWKPCRVPAGCSKPVARFRICRRCKCRVTEYNREILERAARRSSEEIMKHTAERFAPLMKRLVKR